MLLIKLLMQQLIHPHLLEEWWKGSIPYPGQGNKEERPGAGPLYLSGQHSTEKIYIPDSSLGGRAATRREGFNPGKVLSKGRRPIRQPPLL